MLSALWDVLFQEAKNNYKKTRPAILSVSSVSRFLPWVFWLHTKIPFSNYTRQEKVSQTEMKKQPGGCLLWHFFNKSSVLFFQWSHPAKLYPDFWNDRCNQLPVRSDHGIHPDASVHWWVSACQCDMLPPLKSLILKWGLLAQWLYWAKYLQAILACPAIFFARTRAYFLSYCPDTDNLCC